MYLDIFRLLLKIYTPKNRVTIITVILRSPTVLSLSLCLIIHPHSN